ncbi:glycosyltransferase family 2 protein [Phaeovulum vinaykumarii]|uniref:Glycosyltransferase involved in cell wall bisynthesis n=1 Tax=Phaeovulum vinaykumarii TaxID=407234 RepID=A0A1N7JUA6_9RHOB|nr:glycosyltransferase family 2 protein [Phaeovulum vinaykumarii]SIS52917.1 Glycosyltransferase involved in cell wall bisynthesis [Phaeovulum vinaykumarii]SOB91425.1 glycosyltransferase involved in cell wall bisynthesis [Phaeovulum vinaykumarii]
MTDMPQPDQIPPESAPPETASSDKILVFVPCYNCAPQIGRVLAQFTPEQGRWFAEILVLDNGSRDGTLAAARAAAPDACVPRVRIARNRTNVNLGGSHKAAFAYAAAHGFSHVAVLHGDDQGAIADLIPVLAAGRHRRHDACLGARFAPGARLQGYSRVRILGNLGMNALFSLGAGRRVRDLGSGLNIFARPVFADMDLTRAADDLRFNIFLLLGLIDQRRDFIYFPITWREDDQISNVRLVSQAWGTLRILFDHVARRGHFRRADHRAEVPDGYVFDVLHDITPAAGQGAGHGAGKGAGA